MSKPEVIEPSALQVIQRAEIDSTIATAKNFPRDVELALKKIERMVTMTVGIAEETHYSIPRTDKNGKRVNIQGPSVRFAEIVAANWGNMRIASRVIDIGQKQVTAQGICLDLESNVAYDVEVRRSIVSKNGKRYSDDVIVANANASGAIAQRNAVLKAVPRPLWWPIYEAALAKIGGDKTPLTERWHNAVRWFTSRGVSEPQLRAAIGISKPSEVTNENIVTLRGWRNSIEQDSDALEEIFGEVQAEVTETGAKKKSRKRAAPTEVNSKQTETDEEQEEEQGSDEERKKRHAALWIEWGEMRGEFTEEDWIACREAAAVDRIDLSIDVDALERAVRTGSERIQGGRE